MSQKQQIVRSSKFSCYKRVLFLPNFLLPLRPTSQDSQEGTCDNEDVQTGDSCKYKECKRTGNSIKKLSFD